MLLGDAEVTVGGASTINTLPEPEPPFVLVTVTVCAPVVALAPTVTGTVIDVELATVTLPSVMPASPNETVAPVRKPVPVRVTVVTVVPCALALGDAEVTVGLTTAAVTENTLAVTVPASVLVTVTLFDPIASLPETVTGTVIDVELVTVTLPSVMPASPKETVAPVRKPVPVRVTVVGPVPCTILLGDAKVSVGCASTMNTLPEPEPPFVLVTVTVCAPVAALAPTVTGTVIDVELATVTLPSVMPASPKETVAPVRKPVPVRVTVACAEPRALALGDAAVTVGLTTAAVTVNTLPEPEPPFVLVTVTVFEPVASPAETVTGTVIDVELATVTLPSVMPASPKETVAPVRKPVPVRVTVVGPVPCTMLLGDAMVTVGLTTAEVTVKTLAVTVPASVLVTVTLFEPVVSPAETVTGTVIDVELATVTVPRVMPASPNETVAPVRKPDPERVTVVGPVPCVILLGDAKVSVGAASTVNPFVSEPLSPSGFVAVTVRVPVVALAAIVTLAVSCVELT
jgi:hypothetical protein